MENKENEDFYLKLPKKELQLLCKKYGLSAYKTKLDLAKSLASFLQVFPHGSDIGCFEEFRHSMSNKKEASNLQYGLQNHRSNLSSVVDQCESGFDKHNHGSSREAKTCNMPQTQSSDTIFNASSVQNDPLLLNISSRKVPSFEFYVRSEDGIKLYVDLNSNPSDWSKKLKNSVHICQNPQLKQARDMEIGHLGHMNKENNSTLLDTDTRGYEGNNGHEESPSSVITGNGHSETENAGRGDKSLRSFSNRTSTSTGKSSDLLKEDQTAPCTAVDAQLIPNTKCYPGDELAFPNVSNTPQIASACNSDMNSSLERARSFDSLDRQTSRHSNDICERTMQTSAIVGNLKIISMEMHLSEIATQHSDGSNVVCEHGGYADIVVPISEIGREQDGLLHSTELIYGTGGNCLGPAARVKELERSNQIDSKENSEYRQLDNSVEEVCLRSGSESNEGIPKKRLHGASQDKNGCGNTDAKILRSSKDHFNEVLPRRSMRLVSK